MTTPIISIVGWHNAGKTTFLVRLIAELKRRGVRLATIKHSPGHFEMDRPGTDTWRFAQAGSDVVAISGKGQMALLEHRPGDEEITLADIVARLPGDIDLVITEGYKSMPTVKIVVARAGLAQEPIATRGELLALVTDESAAAGEGAPRFSPTDAVGVADLLVARGLIKP